MKQSNVYITLSMISALAFMLMLPSCGGCGSKNSGSLKQGSDSVKIENREGVQVIEYSTQRLDSGISDTIRLGKLNKGEVAVVDLKFHNRTESPVVIVKVERSCGCLKLDYPRQPIMGGESAGMKLILDSADQSEIIYKTITIQTSNNARLIKLIAIAEVVE